MTRIHVGQIPWSLHKHIMPILILGMSLLFSIIPGAQASPRSLKHTFVGPGKYYLALGDSLAFGYQPYLNFSNGYVDDYFHNLQSHGVQSLANLGCPTETSSTFINGNCQFSMVRKYASPFSQFDAAQIYLATHRGQVSPVTITIGSNDIASAIDSNSCAANMTTFNADLTTLDTNLTKVILPRLHALLTVNNVVTGDLLMMNYYDPYQNTCPNSLPLIRLLNQHLANDISDYGTIVDVFHAFGGSKMPNPNICNYTWICTIYKDVHANNLGYSIIAHAFENTAGY